jgi:hypothetical protein
MKGTNTHPVTIKVANKTFHATSRVAAARFVKKCYNKYVAECKPKGLHRVPCMTKVPTAYRAMFTVDGKVPG